MKRRLIIIAVVLAILAMFGFRYMIVEKDDVLPEDVRLSLGRFFGLALAETVPAQPTGTPAVTFEAAPEPTPEAATEAGAAEDMPGKTDMDASEGLSSPVQTEEAEKTDAPDSAQEQAAEAGPVLQKGDSGEEVRALQKRLRALGFMIGAADGKFGPKTEQAVIAFKQHLYELEQERIAAEQAAAEAMAALQAEAGAAETADGEADASASHGADNAGTGSDEAVTNEAETIDGEPAETSGAGEGAASGDRDNAETASGEGESANGVNVTDTADAGSSEGVSDEAETSENGIIDSETAATVGADEEAVPVFDGSIDEETYRLLVDGEFDEYQAKLSAGSRGAEVKRMQEKLRTLGYLRGKADGIFGRQTTAAVKAFQQQNKLTQDGIAGEKTQRALYSEAAKKYVAPAAPVGPRTKGKPYFLAVSTKEQRVYAYSWNAKDGAYTNLVRTMVCSTGLADTPTPKGTYTSTTPVVRWGYFPKYDVWAQYLYRISGPYLFHSVLYNEADESTVKWGSVNKLGSPASHGCIRLSVEDARWIYNNCPAGTTVKVY